MRSELEQKLGKFGGLDSNEPCGCASCLVCRIFGPHKKAKHNLGPSRIIVRDAQLESGGETELKSENVIDRKTGTALHPRKVERVVAGSKFKLRLGIQVWDLDTAAQHKDATGADITGADALIAFVKDGLRALQQTGLAPASARVRVRLSFAALNSTDSCSHCDGTAMNSYRFCVVPESPWLTPWQSDTLAGLLCWACAHTEGDVALQQDVIAPAIAGQPPFVLSDAFPNDWLPVPFVVRLANWPPAQRKTVKRARWLSQASFERFQQGTLPGIPDLIRESGVLEYIQLRNSIGRATNTTSQGGQLFPLQESVLAK